MHAATRAHRHRARVDHRDIRHPRALRPCRWRSRVRGEARHRRVADVRHADGGRGALRRHGAHLRIRQPRRAGDRRPRGVPVSGAARRARAGAVRRRRRQPPPRRGDRPRHVDAACAQQSDRLRRAGARVQPRPRDAAQRQLLGIAQGAHLGALRTPVQRRFGGTARVARRVAAAARAGGAPVAREQPTRAGARRTRVGPQLHARLDRHCRAALRHRMARIQLGLSMEKREELYRGKAKTVYATDDPNVVIMHYRDDVSAFDGAKLAKLDRKGETNNRFNAYVMGRLAGSGIRTHFLRMLNERESVVKKMKMLPVECVVRNVCAGSMAKRYGIDEGTKLAEPLFEFFLKSDALHDPLVNDDHIRILGWASADEIAQMKAMTHKVNAILKPMFADAGIDLVDYKLEFGHPLDDPRGPIVLGDEFTPDGCRLWDATSGEKMDKDRFRRDLGDVIGKYREVATRIGVPLS